jgi:ubiquinone/menaquinone biosynthesis C-methylase UbiE
VAEYASREAQALHHQDYPDIECDLSSDFQRRRVTSSVQFVRTGDVMLEVGCNSGYVSDFCAKAAEIHGVDINIALVNRAGLRLTTARVAQAEALPFPAGTFDFVNISGLLDQVFDPEAVLREAARVSRRSVAGNVTHEDGTWGRHRVAGHTWQARTFSEAAIRALLEQFGEIIHFGTVDNDNRAQCFYFEITVGGHA